MTAENQAKSQHTFDVIAAHLLIQGQPSTGITISQSGSGKVSIGCAYRGDNGMRCAVGFCISNENYHAEMEGKSAHAEIVRNAIGPEYCNDKEFLGELQSIHDNPLSNDSYCTWADELRDFAENHQLDSSIVDTVQAAQVPQLTALAEAHA